MIFSWEIRFLFFVLVTDEIPAMLLTWVIAKYIFPKFLWVGILKEMFILNWLFSLQVLSNVIWKITTYYIYQWSYDNLFFDNIWALWSLIHSSKYTQFTVFICKWSLSISECFLGVCVLFQVLWENVFKGPFLLLLLLQEQGPCPLVLENHSQPRAFDIYEDERSFKTNKIKQKTQPFLIN